MADTLKNLKYMQITGQEKYEIGQDKVSHFPDMEIKDDATLYKKLEDMKRSTFDRSKFTVVGSPTITDDGIASGFNMHTFVFSPFEHTSDNFSFEGVFNTAGDTTSHNKTVFCWCNTYSQTPSYYLLLAIQWSSGGLVLGSYTNNVNYNIKYDTRINYNDGKEHKYKVYYDGTNIKVDIDGDNRINEVYDLSAILEQVHYVIIGATKNQFYFRNGSIDLKQFSIIVDGVEVFNGNKTGIDQIKKDDYTVVGSPVISADGIASGLNSSNRISKNNISINGQDLKLSGEYTWNGTNPSAPSWILEFIEQDTEKNGIFLFHATDGRLELYTKVDNAVYYDFGRMSISANIPVYYEIILTSSSLNIKLYQNNTLIIDITKTTHFPVFSQDSYWITNHQNLTLQGSIDLNAFKIYVDGNLVYQPTLRIPYTQSKTGAKIVDSTYRDRVQDMYKQFGYTHYYTIGDVPEKYNVSVVGSPTLVGGVASGFSANNYLKTQSITFDNDFTIISPIFNGSIPTDGNIHHIIKNLSNNRFRLFVSSGSGQIALEMYVNGTTVSCYTRVFCNNNNPQIKLEYKNNKYTVYYRDDNTPNWTLTPNQFSSSITDKGEIEDVLTLGWHSSNAYSWGGSIDLSQFSITVDGKEVFRGYEPTIPNAYTLQTHKNTDVVAEGTKNDIAYTRTADLTLTQRGTCAAGAVTLPYAYKDANSYHTSARYTAGTKTANGFTAQDAGDFITIGKTVLE